MKRLILIVLFFTISAYASEYKEDPSEEVLSKFIGADEYDQGIAHTDLHPIINEYLAGDGLETSEEFINAIQLKFNFSNIDKVEIDNTKQFILVAETQKGSNSLIHYSLKIIDVQKGEVVHRVENSHVIHTTFNNKHIIIYNHHLLKIFYILENIWMELHVRPLYIENVSILKNQKHLFIKGKQPDYCKVYDLEKNRFLYNLPENVYYKINNSVLIHKPDAIDMLNLENNNITTFPPWDSIFTYSKNEKYIIFRDSPASYYVIDTGTHNVVYTFTYPCCVLCNNCYVLLHYDSIPCVVFDLEQNTQLELPNHILYVKLIEDADKFILIQTKDLNLALYNGNTKKWFHFAFNKIRLLDTKPSIKDDYLIIKNSPILYAFDIESQQEVNPDKNLYHINKNFCVTLKEYTTWTKTLNVKNLKNNEIKNITLDTLPMNRPEVEACGECNEYIFINYEKAALSNYINIYDSNSCELIYTVYSPYKLSLKANNNYVIIFGTNIMLMFDFKTAKISSCLNSENSSLQVGHAEENFMLIHGNKTITLHRFDKKILRNLNPYQITLIIGLYNSYKKHKKLKLDKKCLELFKTLPLYIQNCLKSNYNIQVV